jgi:hypothetical protein
MKRGLPFIILILVSTTVIFGFYYRILLAPNDFMFSDSGDGIKNYFTYYYHIKYDTNYLQFEGMNYPYGEHFLYTDCHPLPANILKFLGAQHPVFIEHAVGIVNFLMIFSILVTILLMYWILRSFMINSWFAIIMALGIGMLAPQLFRLEGHLALSYSAAIPITWALMILLRKYRTDRLFAIILVINNFIWLFIHAYLGMILIAFQFSVLISMAILHGNFRKEAYHYLTLVVAVVLPVIFFYFFTELTDIHGGRTKNPSGFFLYNAELDDVFLPHHPPLGPLLVKLTGGAIKLQWEAWSYVGMTITLMFFLVLIMAAVSIFRKNSRARLKVLFDQHFLNIYLLAATLVLLFAMAVPFKQFPQLLEAMPILKQFRATGRFTWVFFFVSTVFGATVLQRIYRWFKTGNKKTIGMAIAGLGALFMIVEGFPYHWEVSGRITDSPNLFRAEMLSGPYQNALDRIDAEKYQAILPLPFYYQGSESFARPRNDETVRASMVFSAQTGIPILGANLTRTSVPESKKIVQVVTPNFYKKPITDDLSDDRPLLVIRTSDEITDYEQMILEKCHNLYEGKRISVYWIEKAELFRDHSADIIDKYKNATTSASGIFEITDSSSFLYYKDFESHIAEKQFRGTGAFQSMKKGKHVLAEFPPGTFDEEKTYATSIWMYNGFDDALNLWFRYIIEEYDERSNIWHETVFFPEQAEVINGDWSLVEGSFRVHDSNNPVYIVTKGKADAKPPFIADDLLVREIHVDVYRRDDAGILFYNNHQIIKK